jgi:hypothetical protein
MPCFVLTRFRPLLLRSQKSDSVFPAQGRATRCGLATFGVRFPPMPFRGPLDTRGFWRTWEQARANRSVDSDSGQTHQKINKEGEETRLRASHQAFASRIRK